MNKIVLTGAAGRLGSYLREPLSKLTNESVSSDIVDNIGALYLGESYSRADLAQYEEVHALLEGADMVVHFASTKLGSSGLATMNIVNNSKTT